MISSAGPTQEDLEVVLFRGGRGDTGEHVVRYSYYSPLEFSNSRKHMEEAKKGESNVKNASCTKAGQGRRSYCRCFHSYRVLCIMNSMHP